MNGLLHLWFDKHFPDNGNSIIIENAPPIIELEEHEKFILNDGSTADIEVRGERDYDKCYFKVKDLQNAYELKNLYTTIMDNRYNGYQEGKHYVYIFTGKNTIPLKKCRKTIK